MAENDPVEEEKKLKKAAKIVASFGKAVFSAIKLDFPGMRTNLSNIGAFVKGTLSDGKNDKSVEKLQKADKYISNMSNFLDTDIVKEALGEKHEDIKNSLKQNVEKASKIEDINAKVEFTETIKSDLHKELSNISSPEKKDEINYIKAYNQAKFEGVDSKLMSELPEGQKFSQEISDKFVKSFKQQNLTAPEIPTKSNTEVKSQESPAGFATVQRPENNSRSTQQEINAEAKMSQRRKETEIIPAQKNYFEKEMNKMMDKGLKKIESPSLTDRLQSLQQNIDSMLDAHSDKNRIDKRLNDKDSYTLMHHNFVHIQENISSPFKTAEDKLEGITNSEEAADAKQWYSDLIKSARDVGDSKKEDVAKFIKTSIEYQIAKVAGKGKDYLDQLKPEDLPSKHTIDTMISLTKGERKKEQKRNKDLREASNEASNIDTSAKEKSSGKNRISKELAKTSEGIGEGIDHISKDASKITSKNIVVANQSKGNGRG